MHRDDGSDSGDANVAHHGSNGGASCLGRWSESWQSYMRHESNGGAVCVVGATGKGMQQHGCCLGSVLELCAA